MKPKCFSVRNLSIFAPFWSNMMSYSCTICKLLVYLKHIQVMVLKLLNKRRNSKQLFYIWCTYFSCLLCSRDIFDNRSYDGLFDNASTISILMHMFLFSWSYLRNNIIVFICTRWGGDKRESFCYATTLFLYYYFILQPW